MANVADDDDLSDEVRAYLDEAGIPADSASRTVVVSDEQPGLRTFVDLVETSWSLDQAASELGYAVETVAARIARNELYAYPLAHGLRVPVWQVLGGRPIPGLVRLLDGVPRGVHPAVLQEFMTTPAPVWHDLSPEEWLVTGGPVEPLVDSMRERWGTPR